MNYTDEFKRFAEKRDDNGLEDALDHLQELLLNKENSAENTLYEFHKVYDETFGVIEDACTDLLEAGYEYEEDPEIESFHNEVERDSKPALRLIGQDSNAFMVMGLAKRVYQKNEAYFKEKNITWDKIRTEMMAGDYTHLLGVAMEYFDVT